MQTQTQASVLSTKKEYLNSYLLKQAKKLMCSYDDNRENNLILADKSLIDDTIMTLDMYEPIRHMFKAVEGGYKMERDDNYMLMMDLEAYELTILFHDTRSDSLYLIGDRIKDSHVVSQEYHELTLYRDAEFQDFSSLFHLNSFMPDSSLRGKICLKLGIHYNSTLDMFRAIFSERHMKLSMVVGVPSTRRIAEIGISFDKTKPKKSTMQRILSLIRK